MDLLQFSITSKSFKILEFKEKITHFCLIILYSQDKPRPILSFSNETFNRLKNPLIDVFLILCFLS